MPLDSRSYNSLARGFPGDRMHVSGHLYYTELSTDDDDDGAEFALGFADV